VQSGLFDCSRALEKSAPSFLFFSDIELTISARIILCRDSYFSMAMAAALDCVSNNGNFIGGVIASDDAGAGALPKLNA